MPPVDPPSPVVATRSARVYPDPTPVEETVAVEEPLEIRVEGQSIAITMRTPGHDRELAAGFLFTEGVIDGPDDLTALAHIDQPGDRRGNTVEARLAGGVEAHRASLEQATRALYATSSCGICGKASIDRLTVHCVDRAPTFQPDPALVGALPERLLTQQPGFARTGGLHGAALFTPDGSLEVAREDIGRHNAVDKVLGWRLLQDRVPVDDRILLVSSRAGFEIVQKARVAGVSCVVAVGAASSLAIDLARAGGMSLFGFTRPDRHVRYT